MGEHSLVTALLDVSTAAVEFAVNWFLQSSLLIALGLLAGVILRSRGSAAQSVVYRTTLAAILICPAATWLLAQNGVSGWSLQMPAAWAPVEPTAAAPRPEPAPIAIVATAPPPAAPTIESTFDAGQGLRAPVVDIQPAPFAGSETEPERAAPQIDTSPEVAAAAAPPIVASSPVADTPGVTLRPIGLISAALATCWLLVSLALLARLGFAWWELARFRRRTVPADAATIAICDVLAPQLGVRSPAVLRSPYVQSPCLAGLRHAAVLLPEEPIELPMRDVLIHELAHLRRWDCHWKLLHKLATSLFFFQPLVWKLARRIDATSEEVCDDFVMQLGGDRRQYAHGLVDVAELSAAPAAAVGAVGVGIVSLRSMLAHRVARIMDTSRTLSTRVGSALVMLVLVAGMIGTGVVGLVGLKPRASLAVATVGVETDADHTADESPSEENSAPDAPADSKVASIASTDEAAKATEAQAADGKNPAADAQLAGRVLGASGKPVAGAQLYWIRSRVHELDPTPPKLVATTNEKGEFKFIPPAAVSPDEPASWSFSDRLLIKAPGHGFAFTSPEVLRNGTKQSLLDMLAGAMIRLPAAGEPISGRLVDVDGQPIAGVRVRTRWFNERDDARMAMRPSKAADAKIAAWQNRVNALISVIEPAPLHDVLPQATTDADGRFTLTDLGVNRLVQLLVEGPGLETTEIVAHNESQGEIQLPQENPTDDAARTVYGRTVLRAIGPSRAIEGRVVDIDTDQPLAGAVVRAVKVHGQRVSSSREREEFATRADQDGRYRITGMPIGKDNQLVAFTTGDAPYLPVGFDVSTAGDKQVATRDFRLKRGVWAEGRVFDAESKKPFTGEISYYFFATPELKKAVAGIRSGYVDGRYWTNANGEFRVPVLPCRGVLAYRYDGRGMDRDGVDRFPRGGGAELIAGKEKIGAYATEPFYLMPGNYERVVEINPASDQVVRADMPLVASQPVKLHVVDAGGKPVNKFLLEGANERWGWQTMTSADVEITDLKPDEKRAVFAFVRDRNLAGATTVSYGQKEVAQIELQPAGSVTGVIVDGDKVPITDVHLFADQSKPDNGVWAPVLNQSVQPTEIKVDAKGRFRIDGLVPGWKYTAHASAPRKLNGVMQSMVIGKPLDQVTIEPGEVKDLGELVIRSQDDAATATETKTSKTKTAETKIAATTTAAEKPVIDPPIAGVATNASAKGSADGKTTVKPVAAALSKDFTLHYRGQVVNPDGKPVAGAKIYRVYWRHTGETSDKVPAIATTDADGRFEFDLKSSDIDDSEGLGGQFVAAAPGFGVAIGSALDFETTGEALARLPEPQQRFVRERQAKNRSTVLKLVADDAPITGQVVSTEGRPIAGARLRVKDLWTNEAGSLDEFEKVAHQPKADYYSLRNQASRGVNGPQLPSAIADAVTDAEGRFTLKGIGRERVVELRISGSGVETMLVKARTRAGEKIVVPHQWRPGNTDMQQETFLPNNFVQVAGPSHPVTGRIVDADDGRPIANVLVSAGQWGTFISSGKPYLNTRTDADGNFRLEGISLAKEEQIHVLPSAGSLYLPVAEQVTLSLEEPPAAIDFRLKRGVPVRGQAVDKRTGQPIVGHVDYFAFDDNPNLKFFPGFSRGFAHERRTDNQGRFEIPVAPGKGVLTFSPDDHQRYRRGAGSESIEGPTDGSGVGTKVFRTVPLRLVSTNEYLLHGLDVPADGPPPAELKLELDSGLDAVARLFDPERKPLAGVIASGESYGGGWYEVNGDSFTVKGYYLDAPRDLFFFHPARNLAGYYRLEGEPAAALEVVLAAAGNARGRLLDDEGAPIVGVQLSGAGVPAGNFGNEKLKLSTDKDGRFEVRGLLPGREFTLIGLNDLIRGRIGPNFKVTAGETTDLGDVKLLPLDPAMMKRPTAAQPPEAGALLIESDSTAAAPAATKPLAKSPAVERTVIAHVVDAGNKPIADADVAVVTVHATRKPGGYVSRESTSLAVGKTDAAGNCRLQFATVANQTQATAQLIARKEGLALSWKKLDLLKPPDAKPGEVALTLSPEAPLHGRLVDIDGQPCAGVACSIRMLMARSKEGQLGVGEIIAYEFDEPPAAWLKVITSEKDGRFEIHGVPADFGLYMLVKGDERLAPQDIVLNTGESEQRGEHDATYRPVVKNADAAGEIIVPLAPAQWFEGVVRYADTGEPASHAKLKIWASQQQFGSMMSVEGEADDKGHYRINPNPGIRFGVTAFPPDGAPYLIRRTPFDEAIQWETGDRVKQVDVSLKRGVALRGSVINAKTGAPCVGASVQYMPETVNNPNVSDDIVTGWEGIQPTNDQGQFKIVVLPGVGRLTVHAADDHYILRAIGSEELRKSKPGGTRNYAHAIHKIDVAVDQEPAAIQISLEPGATVRGRILDEQGAEVPEALVISPLNIRAFWHIWRGQTEPTLGGRFEIAGIDPDQECVVCFLDTKRRLGATRTLRAAEATTDVVLRPCGQATARYVDAEGNPLKGRRPALHFVMKPGVYPYDFKAQEQGAVAADMDFIANVDRKNHGKAATDADGRIVFPALIPGATYQLIESKGGQPALGKQFSVTAGQTLDLGEIKVEDPK